jgi:hypothetical protein
MAVLQCLLGSTGKNTSSLKRDFSTLESDRETDHREHKAEGQELPPREPLRTGGTVLLSLDVSDLLLTVEADLLLSRVAGGEVLFADIVNQLLQTLSMDRVIGRFEALCGVY